MKCSQHGLITGSRKCVAKLLLLQLRTFARMSMQYRQDSGNARRYGSGGDAGKALTCKVGLIRGTKIVRRQLTTKVNSRPTANME